MDIINYPFSSQIFERIKRITFLGTSGRKMYDERRKRKIIIYAFALWLLRIFSICKKRKSVREKRNEKNRNPCPGSGVFARSNGCQRQIR
jgi:hypothetical protein